MSLLNQKKTQNYSGLLNEIKSSSLNDKIKGRNYKMYMKRIPTSSVDKNDLIRLKSTHGLHLNDKTQIENPSKINLIDKRILDKKKISSGNSINNFEYSKKLGESNTNIDFQGGRESQSSIVSNNSSNNINNKIDIKISVNYGKSGSTHTIIGNNINNFNNNNSSSNTTSKSKKLSTIISLPISCSIQFLVE